MAVAFIHHTGSHTRPNRKARRARRAHATAPVVSVASLGGWPAGSGYARYVGRVGALAVALGLGAAVATGHGIGGVGVAWAEDGETQSDTHDAPGGNPPGGGQPAGPQDESNLNANVPTGTPQPTGTNNPQSGPTNPPSVPQMQLSVSGGAHDPADDQDEDDDDQAGAGVSGQEGVTVTPSPQPSASPQPVTPPPAPAADPAPPAPAVGSNTVVPQTNPGVTAPPTPPGGGKLPDPGDDTQAIVDNPGTGRSALLGGGGTPTLATFSALTVDPVGGPQLLVAAAAPGTPAPAPLVDQPDNLIDAVLGAPVVLANIAITAVTTLLTSFLAPGPGVPAPPVMLFVVLGWVQRELQRTFFNQSPNAVVDAVTTAEDTGVTIPVLANDTDADLGAGDVLTVTDYTQPANGAVVLNPNGTFTYTPAADFNGTDTFTYTVSDEASPWHIHGLSGFFGGGGHASSTTVAITVTPVNDAPDAVDDVADTDEDTAVSGNVLTNDTDIDGDTLTVTTTAPMTGTYGSATINADGTYTYTPHQNQGIAVGSSGGAVTLSDPAQVTQGTVEDFFDSGTSNYVAIVFTPTTTQTYEFGQTTAPVDTVMALYDGTFDPNSPTTNQITINDDSDSTDTCGSQGYCPRVSADLTAGQPVIIVISTYSAGDPLGLPQNLYTTGPGTFAGSADALAAGEIVTDTFTYAIDDGNGGTDTATLAVTITGTNDAPIAVDDPLTVTEDGTVPFTVAGLVGNDTDVDGDTLSATIGQPATGSLNFAGGVYTYTPGPGAQVLDTNETATDTFAYTVSDGNAGFDQANIVVTITGLNDAPVAVDDNAGSVSEDSSVTYNVVANDTDVDAETLTVSAVTDGAYGTVTFTGGTVTYTPDSTNPAVQALGAGDTLTDTFTYTVTDDDATDIGQVSVTITGADEVVEEPTLFTEVAEVPVGLSPFGVALSPDGKRAYVTNRNSNTVSVIDIDPDSPTFNQVIGTAPMGAETLAIAVTPTHAYATRSGGNTVIVIDADPNSPTFNQVIGTPITVGNRPSEVTISPDNTRAYVTNQNSNTVSVIDVDPNSPTFNQVIATIPVGSVPRYVAITPDGTRAYVANAFSSSVSVIDADPGSPTYHQVLGAPLPVGDQSHGLAISPDGTRLYVANYGNNAVRVIDIDPNSPTYHQQIGTPIPVGANPLGITVSPDGSRVYTADQGGNSMSVIDVEPGSPTYGQVIATVTGLPIATGVAVSSDGSTIYVANQGGASLSVITAETAVI